MRRVYCYLILSFCLASGVSGCAYSSPQEQEASACRVIGPKAMIGALGGAAGGAAIGAAARGAKGAAIGAGVGLLAGAIGGYMADQQDCQAAQQALVANLAQARQGDRITWQSASGHRGQYQVTSDEYAAHGSSNCRSATSLPPPGQTPQPLVACRMPNGDYTYFQS